MGTIDFSIKKQYLDLIMISMVLLVWFFIPLLSLPLIFVLWNYLQVPSKSKDTFIIFLLSLTFGLVAYTGQSIGVDETDIARYQFSYGLVSDIESISSFFVLMVLEGGSNPVFYLINFLFSRVFPTNPQVHILFWVTVSYFFTLLGAYNALRYLGKPVPANISKILIFTFLIGTIPFFTVTEIIKQCSSVSIFFYAIVRKLLKEPHSVKFMVLSLLVHASSLILLPLFFLYDSKVIKKYILPIAFGCIIFSFFNFNVVLTSVLSLLPGGALLAQAKEYQNTEVWSISLRHYGTFFFYGVLLLVLAFDWYKTEKTQLKTNVLMVLFLSFTLLLINRGNVHNFIRYIYGFYPFYMLAIIMMLKGQIKVYERYSLALVAILFFTFSNIKLLSIQTSADVNYANSYFDNSWSNLLTSNVADFLNFVV